tara:strand:- start:813 stop:1232 length:420 start_codon:yes stop_codon:yes gene_type:complete
MGGKKGQAGIEYVIIIGVLLVFFIPLIHYSLQETNNAVKLSQIESFMNRLSRAVNSVHTMGPGALKVVTVTIPKGVEGHEFKNLDGYHEIVMTVSYIAGTSEIHAAVNPIIGGVLPENPGTYFLRVESVNYTSVDVRIN